MPRRHHIVARVALAMAWSTLLVCPPSAIAQPYVWTPLAEFRGFTTPLDNVLRVVNLGTSHVESFDLPEGIVLGAGDLDPLTGHYFLVTDAGTGEFAQAPLRLLGLRPWRGSLLRFSPDGAYAYLCTGVVEDFTCAVVRRADEVVVATRTRIERIEFDANGGHVVVTRAAMARNVAYATAADPSVVVWSRSFAGTVAVRGDRVYLSVAGVIEALDSATGQVLVASVPGRQAHYLAAGATRVYAVSEESTIGTVVRLTSYDAATLTMENEVVLGGPVRPPFVSDLAVTADSAAVVVSVWVGTFTSWFGSLRDPLTLETVPGSGVTGTNIQPAPVLSSHPLCRLAVSPSDVVLPSTGGVVNLAVTPDPGCGSWGVGTGALHGRVVGPATRIGPGVVTAWFPPNTESRNIPQAVLIGGVSVGVLIQAPTAPPDAPTNLRVEGAPGAGAGRLHWAPAGTGPVPTGFIFEGGLVGAPPTARFSLPSSARSFDLPPLGAGEYVVQVRARNVMGEGAPSVPVRFSIGATTTPEAPTTVSAVADATVVRVGWTPALIGAAAARFVVEAASTAQGPSASFVPVAVTGPGETSWAGVVPPSLLGAYRLRVRAENAAGSSAASDAVEITATACTTVPATPGQLHATSTGMIVTLAWDAPAGGAEAYVLEAGAQPGGAELAVLPTAAPSLGLTVPAGVGHYFVQVRGRNACGVGPASAPAYVVVPGS